MGQISGNPATVQGAFAPTSVGRVLLLSLALLQVVLARSYAMKVKTNEKTGSAKAARLLQAKYRALSLLDRCLTAHTLDIKEHEGIISGTCLYSDVISNLICVDHYFERTSSFLILAVCSIVSYGLYSMANLTLFNLNLKYAIFIVICLL